MSAPFDRGLEPEHPRHVVGLPLNSPVTPLISVIIPTHNPHPGRLRRTLAGLRAQTLTESAWETIVVDNASTAAIEAEQIAPDAPAHLRVVGEQHLGLTAARRCGIRAARGQLIVMVDDDNVLAPDYLAQIAAHFTAHPRLGAAGGKSVPEFESTPEPWVREFDGLLACRDLGDQEMIATSLWSDSRQRDEYPACSPIGAGLALRRPALQPWLESEDSSLPDRRGTALSSGGDNDIVLTALRAGWSVGYFPSLALTHLIPTVRVQRDYLARLNRGISRSWLQVLAKHAICPWTPIASWTVPLRQAKAWWAYRAWQNPAAYVRWQGACGHFEGRATLPPS